jgi:hypothetical protein
MSDAIVLSEIQIKAVKGLCSELSASMTRAEAERSLQKEAVNVIAKENELPKPLLKKMAKIFHKSRFSSVQEENSELESAYTTVFGDQG